MKSKAVYFPFTHLTEHSKNVLSVFFNEVTMLDLKNKNKDKALIKDGFSRIQLPEPLVEKADLVFAQYLEWIKIHKGNTHNLKALMQGNPYFKEDTQVTSIKSQLKAQKDPVDKNKSDDDFQKHLLFLKAAELCDTQNESIDMNLQKIDRANENMFEALKGIEDSESFSKGAAVLPGQADQGALMTQERVNAWGACAGRTGDFQSSETVLFVTTSPAVFDLFEANANQCVNALDIDEIKVHENECENKVAWQAAFLEQVTSVLGGGVFEEKALPVIDDACKAKGRLKVNLFPGNEINFHLQSSQEQAAVCLVELR